MTQSMRWTAELRTAWPSHASLTARWAGSERFSPGAPPLCLGSRGSCWFVSGGKVSGTRFVVDNSYWLNAARFIFVLFAVLGIKPGPLLYMQGTHSHWAPPSPVLALDHTGFLPLAYVCEIAVCDTVWKLVEQDCVQFYTTLKGNTLCTHILLVSSCVS